MSSYNPKAKNWAFTSYQNASKYDEEKENIGDILRKNFGEVYGPQFKEEKEDFLCFQLERCPDTERLHFQGFVRFKKQETLKTVRELLGDPTVHLEIARNAGACADYAAKEESRVEGPWAFGDSKKVIRRGERTDLLVIKEKLDKGCSGKEIAEQHFSSWCRYHRSFGLYSLMHQPPRNFKTYVCVLWGPSDTGKSRVCSEFDPNAFWLMRSANKTVNWDGYTGQQTTILDDFYGWFPYDYFLRLTDRYPFQLDNKGSVTSFTSRFLLITSNSHPVHWYTGEFVNKKAYSRRFEYLVRPESALSDVERARLVTTIRSGKLGGFYESTWDDHCHPCSFGCFSREKFSKRPPRGDGLNVPPHASGSVLEVRGNTDTHLERKFLPDNFFEQ